MNMSRKSKMSKITIDKETFGKGDYGECECCKKDWNTLYLICFGDRDIWLCEECLEKLRRKLK